MTQKISIGQKILANGALWQVIGSGNGRYTVRAAGEKRTHSIACSELHADLESGKAFLANADAYSQQETSRSYLAGCERGSALLEKLS